jgi:uncharacterized protein YdhG (YjbR/CyaY superfamily)
MRPGRQVCQDLTRDDNNDDNDTTTTTTTIAAAAAAAAAAATTTTTTTTTTNNNNTKIVKKNMQVLSNYKINLLLHFSTQGKYCPQCTVLPQCPLHIEREY